MTYKASAATRIKALVVLGFVVISLLFLAKKDAIKESYFNTTFSWCSKWHGSESRSWTGHPNKATFDGLTLYFPGAPRVKSQVISCVGRWASFILDEDVEKDAPWPDADRALRVTISGQNLAPPQRFFDADLVRFSNVNENSGEAE